LKPLELKIYPEPCLRIKTKPVENFDDDLKETLQEMADIMYISNGIGLAATQVGLGADILIIDIGEGLKTFINPEIVEISGRKTKMEEGCLSLPGVIVEVARPEQVKLRAQDRKGEAFIKVYDGLMAKVVQHEMDHLSGKLIIDYLNPFKYFFTARKLARSRHKSGRISQKEKQHVG